jgi:hypothetical protein
MARVTNIQSRGGTAAQWASANPVLAAREIGLELDTLKMKVGNGSAAWNALPYLIATDQDVSNYWKSPYFLPSTNGANGLGTVYSGAEVIPAGNAAQLAARDHIGLDKFPIMPGDKFVIEFTGKSIGGTGLIPNVGVWMQTALGVNGSTATTGWNPYDSASGAPTMIAGLANGFARYRRTHTVPSPASSNPPRLGMLYFQLSQFSPYTDTYIISDVSLRRVMPDAEIDTVSGSKVTGLTKVSVGLGNVDNTADSAKPLSTAMTTALAGKSDTSHTHAAATPSAPGFLSAADKAKLDALGGVNPLTLGTGDRAVIVPSLTGNASMLTDPTNRLQGADGSKFFTIFDARGRIASPLDNYYGYTSGHNSTQIWLVTAPKPAGPWTYRQAVRTLGAQTPLLNNNHLSSPDVIWFNNQVYLYYHGSKPVANGIGQATALATSTDGVNFTEKPVLALNCVYEEDRTRYYAVSTTYCRMVDAGGYLACVFQANTNLQNDQSGNATPTSVGFATSRDGINWEISPVPLLQMDIGTSGPFGPGLAKIGGMWWLTAYVPADNKVNLWVSDRLEPGTFAKEAAWFGPPAGFDWVDSPIIKYLEGEWHLWYGATDSTYAKYGETFHATLNWSI